MSGSMTRLIVSRSLELQEYPIVRLRDIYCRSRIEEKIAVLLSIVKTWIYFAFANLLHINMVAPFAMITLTWSHVSYRLSILQNHLASVSASSNHCTSLDTSGSNTTGHHQWTHMELKLKSWTQAGRTHYQVSNQTPRWLRRN